MKILIIEDEKELREAMADSLRQEQFVVETAADFDSALEKTGVYRYDCILLDISLPGGSGLDLLKELKEQELQSSVIIVSARDSLDDKVSGLNLGADDYLTKPFHTAELLARVRSVLRRHSLGGSHLVAFSDLSIDTESRTVRVNGQEISLNRKEYDILLYLITNKNRLVLKTALAEHVWGDAIDEVNSFDFVYSQIKNLRKKLNDAGTSLEIQAVYGLGYKLCGE